MAFQPDPEWFKGPYAHQWRRHADNVKGLHDELVRRFPILGPSIRVGLGAESAELVQVPPHERGEPDLEVFYNYELLCRIEVSGSGSRNVQIPPQPIYIRPDKLDLARQKEDAGEAYFFWMVYWDRTWLVRASDAMPHRQDVVKRNWYRVHESYCEIPFTVAKPDSELFDWIEAEMQERDKGPGEVSARG